MTSEQIYQLIIAALGILGTLVTGYAYQQRSRAKVSERQADTDHDNDTTENYVTKRITDGFAETTSENRELNKQLRDCEVTSKAKDATIDKLRSMNDTLGERNEMQANLLKDSARRIKALEDLNNLQEAHIHELEAKAASQLNDGYGTKDKDK